MAPTSLNHVTLSSHRNGDPFSSNNLIIVRLKDIDLKYLFSVDKLDKDKIKKIITSPADTVGLLFKKLLGDLCDPVLGIIEQIDIPNTVIASDKLLDKIFNGLGDGLRDEDKKKVKEAIYAASMLNREGFLECNLNGQVSMFSWETDKTGNLTSNAFNQVVYFGKSITGIDFDVELVESDKKARDFFEKFETLLELLTKYSKYAPRYGSEIASGLKLMRLLSSGIRSQIDDDLEMKFIGSTYLAKQDNSLDTNTYTITQKIKGVDKTIVSFKVELFSPLEEKKRFQILLEQIEFDTLPSDITDHQDHYTFVFTSKLSCEKGESEYTLTAPFKDKDALIHHVAGVQGKVLYAGEWGEGASSGVCYTFNCYATKDDNLKKLSEILGEAESLSFDGHEIKQYVRASQSVLSILQQLYPDKISFGLESGIIFPVKNANQANNNITALRPVPVSEEPQSIEIKLSTGDAKLKLHLKVRQE